MIRSADETQANADTIRTIHHSRQRDRQQFRDTYAVELDGDAYAASEDILKLPPMRRALAVAVFLAVCPHSTSTDPITLSRLTKTNSTLESAPLADWPADVRFQAINDAAELRLITIRVRKSQFGGSYIELIPGPLQVICGYPDRGRS